MAAAADADPYNDEDEDDDEEDDDDDETTGVVLAKAASAWSAVDEEMAAEGENAIDWGMGLFGSRCRSSAVAAAAPQETSDQRNAMRQK